MAMLNLERAVRDLNKQIGDRATTDADIKTRLEALTRVLSDTRDELVLVRHVSHDICAALTANTRAINALTASLTQAAVSDPTPRKDTPG